MGSWAQEARRLEEQKGASAHLSSPAGQIFARAWLIMFTDPVPRPAGFLSKEKVDEAAENCDPGD